MKRVDSICESVILIRRQPRRDLEHHLLAGPAGLPLHRHLAEPQQFIGAGVYAIYYHGDFEPYRKLAELNSDGSNVPIYVGKAVPPGARKGGLGMDVDHGTALFNRLSEHHDSIEAANNLDPDDFTCRFLVVDDIWIPFMFFWLLS